MDLTMRTHHADLAQASVSPVVGTVCRSRSRNENPQTTLLCRTGIQNV